MHNRSNDNKKNKISNKIILHDKMEYVSKYITYIFIKSMHSRIDINVLLNEKKNRFMNCYTFFPAFIYENFFK